MFICAKSRVRSSTKVLVNEVKAADIQALINTSDLSYRLRVLNSPKPVQQFQSKRVTINIQKQ